VRFTIITAAVAAFAVVAVGASAQSAPPTKEAGKLIIGFDLPAPAFWNGRATGTTIRNPSGFEYAMSLAIAKQLKISKVEFLRSPFGGLFSPAPKKYDVAFEEVTITPQRAKVVGFTAPYFDANQGVLIAKGVPKPKKIADLKPLQMCAQKDTTGLTWIQAKLRPAKKPLVYSASSTAAFDAVEAGRCQALVLDVPIIVSQSKKKPGAYGGVVGQIITGESYGGVMEKGSKMKPLIDKAIKTLKANGTLDKLTFKWFGYYPYKIYTLK
jgi:polar amino acid transport system substrate-binding protein